MCCVARMTGVSHSHPDLGSLCFPIILNVSYLLYLPQFVTSFYSLVSCIVGIRELHISKNMLWLVETDLFVRTCTTLPWVHCEPMFTRLRKDIFFWVVRNEYNLALYLSSSVRNHVKIPNDVFVQRLMISSLKKQNFDLRYFI
jgi:hypothetical protein